MCASVDGSCVITKHPDTGGVVSAGTVTAQLLYEIAEPAYRNPDVTAHFDTLRLEDDGPNRVRIAGTRGSTPPHESKVAINLPGGYRNTMTLVLTGLDIEEKAAWAEQELFELLGGREQFAEVDVRLIRYDRPDAPTNEQATAHLRITVKDPDTERVGRRFSNAVLELSLGGYAGFHTTTPPTSASAYGVYWPALVPTEKLNPTVVLPDGTRMPVPAAAAPGPTSVPAAQVDLPIVPSGPTTRAPLGRICAARSGDKGGNANIGLWTKDARGYAWLRQYLTEDRLRQLIPEAEPLRVHRYEMANLHALNFVIVGLLGEGVASSSRPDPQAKGLGEYLRSRIVDMPTELLNAQ